MRDHLRAASGAGLVMSAAVGSMIAAGVRGHSTLDPAMVPLRYARNLADGHGLVFNVGDRVEGFGDPLWTVLLGCLTALGARPTDAATVLGLLGLGAMVILVGWIGTRMLGEGPGVVAALMLAAWPAMWVAARSMDDVTCVGALILWSTGLVLAEREGPPRRLTGVVLVLTSLTGLVGAIAAVVLGVGRKRVGAVLLALVLLTAARWVYFGTPLPAHLCAMPWGGVGRWSMGGDWLLQLLREAPALAGLGVLGLGWALSRSQGWRGPAVVVALVGLVLVGAGPARVLLWHPLVPVMGLIVLLGAGLIAAISRQPVVSKVLLAAMMLGFVAQDFRVAHERADKVEQARRGRFVQARALARFFALRFPDGEMIAAHKVGVLGHFMPNPIIDLSGRADADISHAPRIDLREPGMPTRSDIPSAMDRSPVAFVHPVSMVGKRQGRVRIPPWYPEDFDGRYATIALSSRRHWNLTDGQQIWLFFFLQAGLKPVPGWMKKS